MSNYTKQCLESFVLTRTSDQIKIRFEIYPNEIEVFFYYNDENYFNITDTITDLDNYLQKCKIHKLSWNTYAHVGINNSDGANYSFLCFNRSLKRLTRLDIQRR